MGRHASFSFDSPAEFLRISACVVSVVMLRLFPAAKPHSFGPHFRMPEVRRAMERHTSIATTDNNAQERVAQSSRLPSCFGPAEPKLKVIPRDHLDSAFEIPLTRLLNRLKLNPSGSSGQDPLLQA